MLHIDREKFQLIPEKKILKCSEYSAYLEAGNAIAHAYQENDRLIQYASQLCENLVSNTNAQVSVLVGEANIKAENLIDQANKNAKEIISQANEKSQVILNEAQEKRTQIFNEAKKYYASEAKRGYDDGYSTGKSELAEQLVLVAAKNSENISQLEEGIVGLVMKALKRILGEVDRETLIVNLVRQALKSVKNQQEAILKISPSDSQFVRDNMEKILSDGAVDYLEVTPDSRLKQGTCILETDLGVVDASLEVQMQAIESAFEKLQKTSKKNNKIAVSEKIEPIANDTEIGDIVAEDVSEEKQNSEELTNIADNVEIKNKKKLPGKKTTEKKKNAASEDVELYDGK